MRIKVNGFFSGYDSVLTYAFDQLGSVSGEYTPRLFVPISSDLSQIYHLSGIALSGVDATSSIRIFADTASDRAKFSWSGQVSATNNLYSFSFTYLVR